MPQRNFGGRVFEVSSEGFLLDADSWDEAFAEGMAAEAGIPRGLSREHWDVIFSMRETFERTGECPLVYQTCRANGLHLEDLKRLFPTGYLRGACKLAGLTYRDRVFGHRWRKASLRDVTAALEDRVYRVDARGFLVDPYDWDEAFAMHKAFELRMPEGLTERHWEILGYLRERFERTRAVPTVYETCEAHRMTLDDLEGLFPDGYHRGAVKLAGLRVR